jgi:hypothetical protein
VDLFPNPHRCNCPPQSLSSHFVLKLKPPSAHDQSRLIISIMANSREQSLFGRRRSNTGQSTFRPILPTSATTVSLKLGDSKVLNAWVHDVKDSPAVIFNQSWWPGVAEGDLLKVLSSNADHPDSAFLFMVPKDEGCPKPQLQVYFSFHKQYSGLI